MHRPTVYLFDIDGTLISSGGAGRRAMERAFAELTGRGDACQGFTMAGMTDRAIVRAGLVAIGQDAGEAAVERLLQSYLGHLPGEVTAARDAEYRLHRGVLAALDAVRVRPGSAVGLGTGNVEQGARIKLARVGIADRFGFGGFGCDHEDRAELIAVGAARGRRQLGAPTAEILVVVIGDTPRDVRAAHANGAECIAVATGQFSLAELREAGADHAFADLTEAMAVLLR